MSERYPQGKIHRDDEGACTTAIGSDTKNGVVVIQHEKPTSWVAFPPNQARELAAQILKHADRAERGE